MNPFVFPVESVSIDSINALPQRVQFLLHHICEEFKKHDLFVWIPKHFSPVRHNFRVYKKGLIGDHSDDIVCERFTTLDELDDNVGHCIRQYGCYESSKSYIEDRFLPFSALLVKRDETFKWWLEKERKFIDDLDTLSMHNQRAEATDLGVWDKKINDHYEIALIAKNILLDFSSKFQVKANKYGSASISDLEELTKNQEAAEKAYNDYFKILYNRLSPLRK